MDGESGPVFVGRVAELQRLTSLARIAAAGRPAAALVVAEPGLGKTRLVAEVTGDLELPTVHLRGYELSRDVPLAAAAGLLRFLSRVPQAGEGLEALLLGTAERGKGLETVRLFEAAFRCLSQTGPLAIVVDDLQWADPESLSLLEYLVNAAAPAGCPVFLLCAGRPESAVSRFTLGLSELLDLDCFLHVELRPLDRPEGRALAVALAPDLEADDAERLWREAQGSPFWLEALVRRDRTEAGPGGLLRRRLTGLDAEACRLFALLVVAARPVSLHDVPELIGSTPEAVRRAAAALVDRALVVQEAAGVRVAHDLIREAAATQLADEEQRGLHRALASRLEARAGGDVRDLFSALGHQQASGVVDPELALRIATSPQRRLLGSDGLATLAAVADASASIVLEREVAALATELGEWTQALERWQGLADRLGDPAERARAALSGATAAFRIGRAPAVHALVALAREHGGDDPLVAIEADCHEAQAWLWLENVVAAAGPVVDRAATAAQRLVKRAGSVQSLSDAECSAYVWAQRGRLDAAIRRADSDTVAACAELIRTGSRDPADALAAASDGVFSLLQFEGLPAAAEPRAHRILEEARHRILPSLEVEAIHWTGWIAHHRGRLDEAADHLDHAVTLAGRVGAPRRFTIAQLRAVASSIDASRLDWRRSVADMERAIAAEPNPHFRIEIRLLHIWLVGRFATVGRGALPALLEPMAADAAAAGCGRCEWSSVLYGAEAQARLGDAAGAEAALARWDATHPVPHGGPGVRRGYVAALLEMHRDAAASLPLFADAAASASSIGHELMRLWIELDAARAASLVDRGRGVEELRAVAREAGEMGALSEQKLAVQQLRLLGVRTWRRGVAAVPLTEREVEIARLLTSGRSNPEIAAALFLSRKTVERHVSNILAKSGARNRTELADRLRRMA